MPEVIQGINAFTLGMRAVDPTASVKVVWLDTWFDPARERDAANALVNQGADVTLTPPSAGPWPRSQRSARSARRLPERHAPVRAARPATPITHEVGGYYTQVAQRVFAGTWRAVPVWGGMKTASCLAPAWPVPAEAAQFIAMRRGRPDRGAPAKIRSPAASSTTPAGAPADGTMADAQIQMDFVEGRGRRCPAADANRRAISIPASRALSVTGSGVAPDRPAARCSGRSGRASLRASRGPLSAAGSAGGLPDTRGALLRAFGHLPAERSLRFPLCGGPFPRRAPPVASRTAKRRDAPGRSATTGRASFDPRFAGASASRAQPVASGQPSGAMQRSATEPGFRPPRGALSRAQPVFPQPAATPLIGRWMPRLTRSVAGSASPLAVAPHQPRPAGGWSGST